MGEYSISGGEVSVAIGYQANSSGNDSMALGRNANASGANSTAIGKNQSQKATTLQLLALELIPPPLHQHQLDTTRKLRVLTRQLLVVALNLLVGYQQHWDGIQALLVLTQLQSAHIPMLQLSIPQP